MNDQDLCAGALSESPVVAVERVIFDRTALLQRIGGQAALLPRLLALFVSTVEDTLACLERSAAAADAVEARKLTHTLKGVAANIGADRMHAVILELETFARKGEMASIVSGLERLRGEYELFKGVAHE
jgi:two-component system sensor histidine kinase/response regulator